MEGRREKRRSRAGSECGGPRRRGEGEASLAEDNITLWFFFLFHTRREKVTGTTRWTMLQMSIPEDWDEEVKTSPGMRILRCSPGGRSRFSFPPTAMSDAKC